VHETRRLRAEDVVRDGIPRTKPATAAVHAALWARTPREAALFIVAPVQQRLVNVPDLAEAIGLIKRDKRRRLLRGLLMDLSEGVESLGEGDFAAAAARDSLKQNASALRGRVVLRVPNFAFRSDPEPFLDQIAVVLLARGRGLGEAGRQRGQRRIQVHRQIRVAQRRPPVERRARRGQCGPRDGERVQRVLGRA